MDSFITTFHIDWQIVIAQGVNFIIILVVLYFFALKPLKKVMSERSSKIEQGIEDAKNNNILIENTRKEYEKVINNARSEAHTLFQEGKKAAEEKKKEMMEDAGKEVEKMIQNGKKALESEKIKMVEEAKNEIVSLVVKATEKLLESNVDKSIDEKALNQIKKI